jgi:hypothetical protein
LKEARAGDALDPPAARRRRRRERVYLARSDALGRGAYEAELDTAAGTCASTASDSARAPAAEGDAAATAEGAEGVLSDVRALTRRRVDARTPAAGAVDALGDASSAGESDSDSSSVCAPPRGVASITRRGRFTRRPVRVTDALGALADAALSELMLMY